MATDHHGIQSRPALLSVVDIGTAVLTYIFLLELVLKLIALAKKCFSVLMNVFDALVIPAGVIETLISGTSTFAALRAFRLLHIFRLGHAFPRLNKLANRLRRSLLAVRANFFMFFLFIFIFALMGRLPFIALARELR
jgi:hypothetical protein